METTSQKTDAGLCPSLDIIFMDQLERRLLDTAPDGLRPVLYVRYIDDIFMIWSHGSDSLERFIQH